MILEKLTSRKTKHVTKVRDHIYYMHRKLSKESLQLSDLKGKALNKKVKEIQAVGTRMKQYQKYLNLILL